MNKIQKNLLFLCIGIVTGFAISKLPLYQTTQETPTDSASTQSQTKIIKHIQTSVPEKSANGNCWTMSIATPSNDKAWRCSEGNFIYDPCFDVGNNKVVCTPDPEDEASGITLKLTENLPSDNERPAQKETHAWLYQLPNNIKCYALTGTADSIGEDLYYYSCDNGALMRGDIENAIQKDGPVWTTTIVYRDNNFKITKKEMLDILNVWY